MGSPRIVLSRDAGRDLDQLGDWIATDVGELRAAAILRRIGLAIERIAALPGMGRVRRELEGAPRSFAVSPWIILYEPLPSGDGVLILRVVDGRRDLSDLGG
ncbi:MAG: type II toxin-antitoxin system RelE/ParE family toxin [Caulobacteraceae bacterium]|nr:type II toxin-antitoxin system RelE/ParE family toxin [Caulobacteraceae bacterium]